MTDLFKTVVAEVNQLTGGHIRLEIAQLLQQRVRETCKSGGAGDPLSNDRAARELGKFWCTVVVSYFLQHGWLLPARELLLELWNDYAGRQRSSGRRIYRALLSQLLTETAHRAGRNGEALRWSLLTQADDVLGKHAEGGGHGRHWLYGIFGVSHSQREHLNRIGEQCRTQAERSGWEQRSGFAEEVVCRAFQGETSIRSILQRYPISEEFPLTRAFIRVLLDDVKSTKKAAQKGARLEELACYLFSLVSGSMPRRNVVDKAGASEYDLVVTNVAASSSLADGIFGGDFLVECKNWRKAVGAQEVGYFLFRMSLTHSRFGVMLSRQGITSAKRGEAFAASLIRRAFHEHGSVCVVLNENDLVRLCKGEVSTLTGLLIERLAEFRFGKER